MSDTVTGAVHTAVPDIVPGSDQWIIEMLLKQAISSSNIQRQMAEAKSLRQHDCDPPRADLYFWPKPEETVEGKAATRLLELTADRPHGDLLGRCLDVLAVIDDALSGVICPGSNDCISYLGDDARTSLELALPDVRSILSQAQAREVRSS